MGILYLDYWPEHHKYITRIRSKSVSCMPNGYRQDGEKSPRHAEIDVSAVIQGESEGDGVCQGSFRQSSHITGGLGISPRPIEVGTGYSHPNLPFTIPQFGRGDVEQFLLQADGREDFDQQNTPG